MKLADEIKASFKAGNNLIKLIYINIALFIAVQFVNVILFLFRAESSAFSLVDILSLPADGKSLLLRPWSIFTYMFLHEGFLHILFNMLWLYWFGTIFLKFQNQKKLLTIYLLGGISGGLLYIISYNIFPVFADVKDLAVALGASASVMAIVIAATSIAPDFPVYIPFINDVKIKYIAVFFIVTDIMQIPLGNAGGHIAHIGGALLGYFYIHKLNQGQDIGAGFDRLMERLFSLFKSKPAKNMKVKHSRPVTDMEYNARKAEKQARIDQILEKVSRSGYDSLTKEEKDILFNMSNNK